MLLELPQESVALGVTGRARKRDARMHAPSGRVELMADLWLPEGASIRASEREARREQREFPGVEQRDQRTGVEDDLSSHRP